MKKFIILIPVYNDWKSLSKLLGEIDLQLINYDLKLSILIINDSSTERRLAMDSNFKKIQTIKIINMKKNQGHGRCFATGLRYVFEKEKFDYVIPMDADGEDRPEELSLLIDKSKEHPDKVITANRIKRSEGIIFKSCYEIHKYLTLIFAGHLIKFGNYSCLPKHVVIKMLEDPSTWNSFSGSLVKLVPYRIFIPSIRNLRYYGPSKMSFLKLLIHSLSIMSVFKKTVFLRSIIFLLIYLFLIFQSLSLITLLPVFLVIILLSSVALLSDRENLDEYKRALDNISSIDSFN